MVLHKKQAKLLSNFTNEINRFKGNDVVALFVQGAEFLNCECTLRNCFGISSSEIFGIAVSIRKVNRNSRAQSNHVITFDSHLKTARVDSYLDCTVITLEKIIDGSKRVKRARDYTIS